MQNVKVASAAVDNLPDDYVRIFTSGGKPIWVKLSLPSGGTNITLVIGGSIMFRLDYCFDRELKPVAGDTLQLFVSDLPRGTFILPSNMHTLGNEYRNGVITLKFADVGDYKLQDGVDGWLTITFYVSGDEKPGTFVPRIVGNGSAEDVLYIDKIVTEEPGTGPVPPGGDDNSYLLIGKLAEHILYPDGDGGYIRDFYQYVLPITPAYISYEILLNTGSGQLWQDNHVGDFDYLSFTDTLGEGQVYAVDGEPYSYSSYNGASPISSIAAWRDSIDGSAPIVNQPVDLTDPKVQVIVSPDRKTFTLKIEKGAKILYTDNGFVDEYTKLRIDYYAKITDETVTEFINKAEVSYVKDDEVDGGNSSDTINVIKQSGAAFIYKETGRGTEDYYEVEDSGLHGYDNPLMVEPGDELIFIIRYKITGDGESIPAGNLQLTDLLDDRLEFMYHIIGHSGAFVITQDISNPQKLILVNNWNFEAGNTYNAYFRVRVNNIAAGEVISNTVGTNTIVVKKDGYAIQILKQDADDSQGFLMGAEFALYVGDNGSWVPYTENATPVVLTTGNDGKTEIKNLPVGKYKLLETKAPDGYPAISPANQIAVEFEILPVASGLSSINRILLLNAPGNISNPVSDKEIALFNIFNDKESEPKGNLMIIKDVASKIDGRDFYVMITADDDKFLEFDADTGNYNGKSDTEVQIEINDSLPVLLKGIPLSLGAITVTETAGSRDGYDVTYYIGGIGLNNIVYLTENKQTVFITVINVKSETTSVTISGIKEVKGTYAPKGSQFTFTLTQVKNADGDAYDKGAPVIRSKTVTTDVIGEKIYVFTFEEITGLEIGTYYFKIEETVGGGTGWSNDTGVHIVAVEVTNHSNGGS